MFDPSSHLLLTGGTGFFGVALLRHLKTWGRRAPRVTVLSRNPERFQVLYPDLARSVDWVCGDVLEPKSLPYLNRFSHVLHAATDSTAGPQLTPLERYTQIVEGTRNVLELACSVGASRFLLTSSGGVYGTQPSWMDKIQEDYLGMPDPLNAVHVYGVAKRTAEHLCVLYQQRSGLETVIARCFAFVGDDLPLNVHFAIGNFIRDALSGQDVVVSGNGLSIRSYMYQEDLAHWLLTLLFQGRAGHAYNVGSDEAISIGELAHLIRDLISPNLSVQVRGAMDPWNGRHVYVPCIDKARNELGLTLRHDLAQSIRKTVLGLRTRLISSDQRQPEN